MSVSKSDFSSNSGIIHIQQTNNKRDREEFPASDSGVSSAEVKRKRILNYCGKGEKEWQSLTSLIINEQNITTQLQRFRTRSIALAEEVNNLSSMRIWALSHVFPIDEYNNNLCSTRYMKNGYKELKEYAYSIIALNKASPEVLVYIHSIIHSIIEGSNAEEIVFNPSNSIDNTIKRVCLSVIQANSGISSGSESTFVDKYLMPFIRNIFLYKSPESIFYSLAESRQLKSRTKPDVMVGVQIKKKIVYLFFVEVKRTATTSKYQEEDDFVKLMKYMKDSIDNQISLGIEEPRSFGVLCEGFICSFYTMPLAEEGMYLPVHMSSFRFAQSDVSLIDVIIIVQYLKIPKVYWLVFDKRCYQHYTHRKKRSGRVSQFTVKRILRGYKKKKMLSYFNGEGKKEWSPVSSLIVNGRNITTSLNHFRNKNIGYAEEVNNLSSMRMQSLSHIFPISKFKKGLCTTKYLKNGRPELLEYGYKNINLNKASPEALVYVHSVVHTIIEGGDSEEVEFCPKVIIDKDIKRVCTSFIEYNTQIASGSESTFVDKYLMPFIRNVFLYNSPENLIYSLAEGRQNRSRATPDVMVGVTIKKKEAYLLFIEVKRPETTSKYQEEDDFIKLMKHLKHSIDFQISLGIDNPKSYGVLCEGYSCLFYVMTLVEDGIYLPVHLSSFSLVENKLELMNVILAVESFEMAKEYISNFEEVYYSKTKKNDSSVKKFKKMSFKTKFEK